MKIFITKSGKNVFIFVEGLTKILHWLIQLIAILSMIILSFAGIYKLFIAFYQFSNIYEFLKELLHSLEILFIAPIPILITYSFKKYVLALFNSSIPDFDTKFNMFSKTINSYEAEKAFITSIIGITSTFILGLFIELLAVNSNNGVNTELSVSHDFILILSLAFVFLVLQILLYRFISKSNSSNTQG